MPTPGEGTTVMLMVHSMAAKALSEFVGLFALCAIGIGSLFATSAMGVTDPGSTLLVAAFAHGLTIAIMITAVGHISGGNLNPAVTFAAWLTKQKSTFESLIYIGSQLAGGLAGAGFVCWVFPDVKGKALMATPTVANNLSFAQGVAVEAVLTFLLVWVVFSTALDRDGTWFRVAGLPIGLAVTVGILMGAPLTGAAMNPARVLGPALTFNEWSDHWVYWVGPFVGAAAAGLAYMNVVQPRSHGAPQPKTL